MRPARDAPLDHREALLDERLRDVRRPGLDDVERGVERAVARGGRALHDEADVERVALLGLAEDVLVVVRVVLPGHAREVAVHAEVLVDGVVQGGVERADARLEREDAGVLVGLRRAELGAHADRGVDVRVQRGGQRLDGGVQVLGPRR